MNDFAVTCNFASVNCDTSTSKFTNSPVAKSKAMNFYEKILVVLLTMQTAPYGVFLVPVKVKLQFASTLALRVIWMSRIFLDIYCITLRFNSEKLQILTVAIIFTNVISSFVSGCVFIRASNYISTCIRSRLCLLSRSEQLKLIFLISSLELIKMAFSISRLFTQHSIAEINRYVSYFIKLAYPFDFWIASTACIYTTIYTLNQRDKVTSLQKAKSQVNYFTWLRLVVECKNDTSQFEDNLATLPSLWLLYSFIGSAGNIELFQNSRRVIEVTHVLFENVPWIVSLVLVTKMQDKVSTCINSLRFAIFSSDMINASVKMAIGSLLLELTSQKVTASSFLTIDKCLFVPYLGSVFTYTLLLQDKFSRKFLL